MDNPFSFLVPVQRTRDKSFLLSAEVLVWYKDWAARVAAGDISPNEVGARVLALVEAVEGYRRSCVRENAGLVSVHDAAVICGLSANALYIAFHRGRLPEGCFVATGKKKGYKVNLSLLFDYIQNNPVRPK